jgi:small-conductance mechanosensitive channel
VIGIALGFGSQTLVRDIISGVFFLSEDAFRIGEYIQVGTTRGTVEGIAIRSVRLRHHRGPVHTLPFGEIKQLTNYSRDWIIMKLEFLLAFGTDLQKVRKLVKKVGEELSEHPSLGPALLDRVKSQGVRRMEPTGVVVGINSWQPQAVRSTYFDGKSISVCSMYLRKMGSSLQSPRF